METILSEMCGEVDITTLSVTKIKKLRGQLRKGRGDSYKMLELPLTEDEGSYFSGEVYNYTKDLEIIENYLESLE